MNDLNTLSLDELKKLQKEVTKAIESYEDRARKAALSEIDSIAKQHGFTVEQLLGKPLPGVRKTVAAKYANPADKSQTWTGRGRKPKWVVEALANGKSMDDLLI